MQEKKKHLVSREPLAYGQNALLQKQLDSKCTRMAREHRNLQKQLHSESEKCVTSIYALLMEAEHHEKEAKEKEKERKTATRVIHAMQRANEVKPKTKKWSKQRIRPITAPGLKSVKKVAGDDEKRPVSAHASVLLAEDDSDSDDDVAPERPSNSMNRRISMATLRNLEKRTSIDNVSILRPWQKIKEVAIANKTSAKTSDESNKASDSLDIVGAMETKTVKIQSSKDDDKVRPKTAEYYSRKHPDDERSEYWNRRVNSLIRKWNMEERGENYLDRKDILKFEETGPPPHIPFDADIGNAAIKVKSFVRKYANTYRTLLSITTESQPEMRQKRSEKITRQELASIHADAAKRRKNTRLLLRKSKRLKSYVEQLATSL